MLLTTARFRARIGRFRQDDDGYVLVAVLGTLIVVMLLSTAVISAVIGGITVTARAEATAQSGAAADAGIDVARGGLVSGTACSSPQSGTGPSFSVSLSYSTTAQNPSDPSTVWIDGCPPESATFVKAVSRGYPSTGEAAGESGRDTSVVEAILRRSSNSVWELTLSRDLAQ